uniref:Uncharacterized protein n=1 Tax=Kryptolebias marmoratus TaxID=37003 RepID=A0A3Q3BKN7_KRYMA
MERNIRWQLRSHCCLLMHPAFHTTALTAINYSNERTYISCLSHNTANIDSKCIRRLFGACLADVVTIKVLFFLSARQGWHQCPQHFFFSDCQQNEPSCCERRGK